MKNFFLFTITFFSSVIILSSCQNDKNYEITKQIEVLYSKNKSTQEILNDSNLWTASRLFQFRQIELLSEQDKERISKSSMPTDKPILLEGSIFTSLYDGFTSYKIQEYKVENDTAYVIVSLSYAQEGAQAENWIDTVVFIKEKQWRIDNIQFDKNVSNYKSLSESLIRFVMHSCKWSIKSFTFNKISAIDSSQAKEWLGKELFIDDSIHFDMQQIPSYASMFSNQKACKIKDITPFQIDPFEEGFIRELLENPKNKNISFYNINTECETSPNAHLIINSQLDLIMLWDGTFFMFKPVI